MVSYLMPSGYPNTTTIPAGIWSTYLHMYRLNSNPNTLEAFADFYSRDTSGNETFLFGTDPVSISNITTPIMINTDTYQPGTYSLSTTDRILMKVKVRNLSFSLPNTAYLVSEGTEHYSFVQTTLGILSSSSGTSGSSGSSGTSGSSGSSGSSGTSGSAGTSGTSPSTNLTLSGDLVVSGQSTFTEVTEVINSTPAGATASTVTYDFSSGNIWYHGTASQNYTADFINVPTTNFRTITTTVVIAQGETAYIPTSVRVNGTTSTVKWSGGTASGSANKVDIIGFSFIYTNSGIPTQVLGQINSFN
jgi:hypothetical protein